MRHAVLALLTLSTLSPAHASEWADFEAAFPLFPCHDGWTACLIEEDVFSPAMEEDSEGRPMPSHFRISWFDLRPTRAFDPFAELSQYTGELPTAEPEPEPEPEPRVAAARDPSPTADPAPASEPAPSTPRSRPEPAPATAPSTARTRPEPAPTAEPAEPESAEVAEVDVPAPPPAPVFDGDCDPTALESQAMLGKLEAEAISCLDMALKSTMVMTEKKQISLLLMINAYSKGDKRAWESLVKRHLEEIDRSDPDLCYKYASHLAKKGPSRASAVIRWSDVALENRTVWTGKTYTKRVYNLYKMKAISAQNLWRRNEETQSAEPSDVNQKKVEKWRNMTKVMAREWLEFAKGAGLDTGIAKELCNSAAGHEDYCERV